LNEVSRDAGVGQVAGFSFRVDVDVLRPSAPQAGYLTRKVQIVFQDPNSSMNPRRTVRQALVEAARVSGEPDAGSERSLVAMLDAVGLLPRRPYKVVAVALANKMARVIWALLTKGGTCRGMAPVNSVASA
jgi:ABC-type glutathione transport system ATPase component